MSVNIYHVDRIIAVYAKHDGSDYAALRRRYTAITKGKRFNAAFPKYGPRGIVLEQGSGGGSYAHFYSHSGPLKNRSWLISLGANRNEPVMLHEIAHHVARLHPQYGYCADHGPGFASALLDVVRVVLGAEAERSVRHAYKALRIKVYKPGKRNGGAVRAPGQPPAATADIIAAMIERREKAANERALARQVLRAVERPRNWGERAEADCPACEGTVRVSLTGRTRKTRRYYVRCENRQCLLAEEITEAA